MLNIFTQFSLFLKKQARRNSNSASLFILEPPLGLSRD